jgi:hypothetical protein
MSKVAFIGLPHSEELKSCSYQQFSFLSDESPTKIQLSATGQSQL